MRPILPNICNRIVNVIIWRNLISSTEWAFASFPNQISYKASFLNKTFQGKSKVTPICRRVRKREWVSWGKRFNYIIRTNKISNRECLLVGWMVPLNTSGDSEWYPPGIKTCMIVATFQVARSGWKLPLYVILLIKSLTWEPNESRMDSVLQNSKGRSSGCLKIFKISINIFKFC